jgi:hypothetical protein
VTIVLSVHSEAPNGLRAADNDGLRFGCAGYTLARSTAGNYRGKP